MADQIASARRFPVQTSKRRSDQAFQQILALIFEGRLSPGARLPGERELTETLGLSRTTLRDALNRLEARGYIDRRSKSGSFVCTSLPQPFREPIEEIVDSNVISTSDIIEIRKVLELWAVGKAAQLPARDSLTALARCLRAMEATSAFRSDSQFTRYRAADLKFHQTIAEMTGNLLYVHVFHFFLDLVRRSISLSRQLVPGEFAKDNLRNHQEIYKAIKKRDSERAKRAMLEHFRYVEQHISPRRRRVSSHNKKPGVVNFRSRQKIL
jgi:GntR family transcriptional repressor for pyruvate dehydrogenase complex